MKIKKTSYPPVNIGTSFMLVLFLILCMIIFAVLSLSTALKDQAFSQKNAVLISEYYMANNAAEEKLAEIDQAIADGRITEPTVTYLIPINDNQSLQVVLEIHPDQNERYKIVTWKQIPATDWNGDQTLPLLGSE